MDGPACTWDDSQRLAAVGLRQGSRRVPIGQVPRPADHRPSSRPEGDNLGRCRAETVLLPPRCASPCRAGGDHGRCSAASALASAKIAQLQVQLGTIVALLACRRAATALRQPRSPKSWSCWGPPALAPPRFPSPGHAWGDIGCTSPLAAKIAQVLVVLGTIWSAAGLHRTCPRLPAKLSKS